MFDLKRELRRLLGRYLTSSLDFEDLKKGVLAIPRRESSSDLIIRDKDDEILLAKIFERISEVAPSAIQARTDEEYSLSETEFKDWLTSNYDLWEKGTLSEQDWP